MKFCVEVFFLSLFIYLLLVLVWFFKQGLVIYPRLCSTCDPQALDSWVLGL